MRRVRSERDLKKNHARRDKDRTKAWIKREEAGFASDLHNFQLFCLRKRE